MTVGQHWLIYVWVEPAKLFAEVVCMSSLKAKKVKGFPYLIPSIGLRADPGVQAVSPQVTVSHPPGGRLPLLSAMLPSQPQSIATLWPLPSYTAW